MASKPFTGKVALITGASSGIGAGTAIELASKGCAVALSGRNAQNLLETASKCEATGLGKEKMHTFVADLENENDCTDLVQKVIDQFGKLDILINNAGMLTNGSIEDVKLEDYDKTMNLNVRSLVILTQAATPYLIASKGNIVNISSIAGTRSFPNILAYCMSKAAVDQFTRCVALELAAKSVRVNSVNPGVIVTEIHKRAGMSDQQYQEFLNHSKETHALGRPGTVDEVAKTVVFLASDDASFITGQTLPIDGGRGIMCPR